jgi:hypothetical protein
MNQLAALIWLKWTLMRHTLRSRKAKVGTAATAIATLAGLTLALGFGAAMGALIYAVLLEEARDGIRMGMTASYMLLFLFVMIYLLWTFVPIGLGGGSRFDAGRMLLYPISLPKLFIVDFLSELTTLATIFATPAIFGIALGAGLATGSVVKALLLALVGSACGLALAKLLSTAVGSLMRHRRTRGETVLALLGGVVGLAGAAMGQLAPYFARHAASVPGLHWTPPGAMANALTLGLRPGGEWSYVTAFLTLLSYTVIFVLVTYRIARRSALGMGGTRARKKELRATSASSEGSAGWRLPWMSPQLAALVEKELRYALRNAQLKVIAVMAVGLTLVLRLAPLGAEGARGGGWSNLTPYSEGAGTVFGVLYVFMLVSPLSTNLFGYDGAGLRSLVLAPVERTKILLGKNLALTLITAVLAFASIIAGGLVFADLSAGTLLFAGLAFVIYAGLFSLLGNWLSLHFPKRVEFGKRMHRSGVAGLLLIPVFIGLALPPVLAVVAAHLAESHFVKYAILAAFAAWSMLLYVFVVPAQGRSLERRELEIMEAVTGKTGEDGGQILG